MKRDMNLVRRIVLMARNAEPGRAITADDFPDDDAFLLAVQYHVRIMIDAGLLIGNTVGTLQSVGFGIDGLTWEGQDFADLFADDATWATFRRDVLDKAAGATLDAILAAARAWGRKTLLAAAGLS